jgi:glycosyltransferase involved in cell wall biosynthesis
MLSIIIPTLNEEKYLPVILKSIQDQSFKDYEIIISDGGSNDRTLEIAGLNHCRTTIDNEHHHPSWQRNNGAALAREEILLFLDADTILPPDFLSRSISEFKNKNLVGAGFYIKFNPTKLSRRIFSAIFNFFCFGRQYFAPIGAGSALMARKKAHDSIKGFDCTIYVAEDFDYCYRLSRRGKFRMISSSFVYFSARRLEKEGDMKVLFKWIVMGFFTFFNFKIKKKIIKYDFGKY